MAQTKQKRDNAYYLDRLRVKHPNIYADYQAGLFRNLTEALVKAGIRKKRTSLDALKAGWKKATAAERDAFKAFIGCSTPSMSSAPVATSIPLKSSSSITSSPPASQRLPSALKTAVLEIMKRRALKNGDVMREIGQNPLNPSLGMALNRGTHIQNSLIKELEDWVAKNKAA